MPRRPILLALLVAVATTAGILVLVRAGVGGTDGRVAVGQPAYPTPSGTFAVTSKQVDPVWTAPNSPWAGELAGQSVDGGAADNPLKARWMGLAGGVGIHGTGEPWSIGTRASHGCIRMTVPDVIDLFNQVPMGAPVFIQ